MAEKQFHKGDRVRFRYGTRWLQGVIIEVRGPIGVRGRRLYLVEFRPDSDSTSQVELPPDELESVTGTASLP